ncbi:CHAP domain-containing protein [Staphylococcus xylosus]|uniref:CHAP domain-containing protein n=1 Tax=Staphylococcus xylosus TaxID=1288 RepID=UPI000D1D2D9E|nr:CHAP domain-containing protein [Staphylococcus xylosus]MCM3518710.1 CHAP domain-containing protein [Staphylococcus xylosus]MCQ3817440.1 CHAP domain-containing protein [Staphylococcus xylosus]MCQ3820143.1 CHAP domain-containing protein [Staphylococcus xylosus]PTH99446.1 CHAP domain-containing protein [Staphylococcus xylosus]UBV37534.1 CHAP domain-containing protein [Staphylococcus xylosus]
MKKLLLKGSVILIFTSSLNVISTSDLNAQTYRSIEEAKKDHPNAQFSTQQSDGSFSYSYNEENKQYQTPITKANLHDNNSVLNSNQKNKKDQNSTFNNGDNENSNNQNSVNNELLVNSDYNNIHNHVENTTNNTDTNIPASSPTPSNNLLSHESNTESKDLSKAYKKDDNGIVTYIDMDALYDELQLEEFNEKAQTVDGKPLALGNGKIIDKPAFTSKNNLYTTGQCTWYVFDKRAKDGETISTFWGDARNWAGQASASGFKVDHKPAVGSILQTSEGPYGHVAYVERVNSDGSIFISEMNWVAPYITSTRTISASEVSSYNFIH